MARCTVERLMWRLGLRGVMRGKVVRTTVSDSKAPCALDRVNRQCRTLRPNQLWVSDFTYVSTWQGWLYVDLSLLKRRGDSGLDHQLTDTRETRLGGSRRAAR